jgi:hypothetical protein
MLVQAAGSEGRGEAGEQVTDQTRIRIIVDKGEINCPICKVKLEAGLGHSCRTDGEWISGATHRLPDEKVRPPKNHPRALRPFDVDGLPYG